MTSLERALEGRIVAGVCTALARRFGIRPLTLRVLFLLSCLLPGPQLVAYLAMWIMSPTEQRRPIPV
ncbi:PspC domain-containing protein [Gryllotalpicola ginsengisoli]|uniref:PspC domain-containing protein n=1 Tax=Gryllotalpicola ginsengisoli TaxID=444608 RepID=UPI0003B6C1FE|nr:PspC domain-containing protein [Gryllotalpicola ginsengisoli]